MTPKWRNRLLNLALLAASLLVCLLLFELAARLYTAQEYEQAVERQAREAVPEENLGDTRDAGNRAPVWEAAFDASYHIRSENPELGYRLRPSAQLSPLVKTNAHGFRDNEFDTEKPAETFRIVVVGDSVAFGWDVPLTESFPRLLPRLLNRYVQGGRAFEVYNMAVDGYDARQEAELVRTQVFPFQPDLLIVGYCVNDHFVGNDVAKWRKETQSWSRAARLLKHTVLNAYYRATGDLVREAYTKIARLCAEKGVPVLVTLFPPVGGTRLPDEVQALCADLGMMTVNLASAYDAIGRDRLLIDDVHPTAFGHQIAAEEVAAFLCHSPGSPISSLPQAPLPDFQAARNTFIAGEAALRGRRAADAAAHFKRVVQMAPVYANLAGRLLLRAGETEALLELGRVPEARAGMRECLAQHPGGHQPYTLFDWLLRQPGAREARRRQWLEVAEAQPESPYPRFFLGNIEMEEGNLEAARAHYERACALAPARAMLHTARGQTLLPQRKFDQAAAAFREALRLDPRDVPARMALVDSLLQADRRDALQPHIQFFQENGIALRPDLAERIGGPEASAR